MGADHIVYCLEKLTDYAQFERLCHDLMALEGYKNIEPLGGSQDKGRDAIHVDSTSGKVTLFAYSVRDDWQRKLTEDCDKIRGHGHACSELVFLTTAGFTSGERDKAKERVMRDYGWPLELYGLERLRTMLASTHPHLVEQHPQIFSLPGFQQSRGLSLATVRGSELAANEVRDISNSVGRSPNKLWDAYWMGNQTSAALNGLSRVGCSGFMEIRASLSPPKVSKRQAQLREAAMVAAMPYKSVGYYHNECVFPGTDGIHGECGEKNGPPYYYWAIRIDGDFYFLGTLEEDFHRAGEICVDCRISLAAEALVYLQRLYTALGVAPEIAIGVSMRHVGLEGRRLTHWHRRESFMYPTTRVNEVLSELPAFQLGELEHTLVENVMALLAPLFQVFNFQEFGREKYEHHVNLFRGTVPH